MPNVLPKNRPSLSTTTGPSGHPEGIASDSHSGAPSGGRNGQTDLQAEVSIVGCGWLGFAVAQRLIQLEVRVAGSTTTPKKLAGLRSIGVDSALLRLDPPADGDGDESPHHNSEPLKRLFAAPQMVVTIPPPAFDEAASYVSNLTELVARWTPVGAAHLIFISSTSVYGDANGPTDESLTPDPTTSSARLMYAAELALGDACRTKQIRLSVIRSAGQIGFGRHPGRFLAGKANVANPDVAVNIIHQSDLAECVAQLIMQTHRPTVNSTLAKTNVEIYNAAANTHPTRRDFYEAASRTLNLAAPSFAQQDKSQLPGKLIHSEKIRKQLNLKFQFDDLMAIAMGKFS